MSDQIGAGEIEKAISEVEEEVLSLNNPKDTGYFLYHKKRFLQMAITVTKNLPKGAKILDIGSHFLHPAMILTKLGYQVQGVDVPAFFDVDFINDRRSRYGIAGISESNLESFESMAGRAEEFDAVLFTEILEHITFNPVAFWKKVYQFIKNEGFIYLTTPNSLALPSIVRASLNLIRLRGIGIKVDEILHYETYGHHWKEYSRPEIKRYYGMLSEDFEVATYFHSFYERPGNSLRDRLWHGLGKLGHLLHFFAPCLEVIVKVNKEKGFKVDSPEHH